MDITIPSSPSFNFNIEDPLLAHPSRVQQGKALCAEYGSKICQTLKNVGSFAWNHKAEVVGGTLMGLGAAFATYAVDVPGAESSSIPGLGFLVGVGVGTVGLAVCIGKRAYVAYSASSTPTPKPENIV